MSRYNKTVIALLIIAILTIIFLIANISYRDKEIRTLQVQLDDKEEVINRLDKEKANLQTRLDNYTIKERQEIE